MLDMNHSQQFTDVIHRSIVYSGIEREIIGTPIFNRLHRILQNSLVYLTFPCNKVKRFEHSIGTMHLAGQMFFYSICNSSEKDIRALFDEISQEIVNWRRDVNKNELSHIPQNVQIQYNTKNILNAPIPRNALYYQYTPGNLPTECRFAYYVAFQSVRLAALLHDVGHLPYSHILENALENLYQRVTKIQGQNDAQINFLSIMNSYINNEEKIHEVIGNYLVDNIIMHILDGLPKKEEPERFFLTVVFDLAKKILKSQSIDNSIYNDLHRIISGVIDADRLDYCSRDAFFAGTNQSIFPYLRFLSTYSLTQVIDDTRVGGGRGEFYFCPAAKSKVEIENLIERRWRIFTDINFHHRSHKYQILLEEVLADLGEEELNNNKTGCNDNILELSVCSIWSLIGLLKTNTPVEYKIIQLDDSWLDTLLKCSFFEKYGNSFLSYSENAEQKLWNRFDELIAARKHYISMFKRSADFRIFDELLFNMIKKELDDKGIKDHSKLNLCEMASEENYTNFIKEKSKFCFEYIRRCEPIVGINIEKSIEDTMNQIIHSSKDYATEDCLIRLCSFSTGCNTHKDPVYVIDARRKQIKLEQLCPKIDEVFRKERQLAPYFHLYYLPTFDKDHSEPNRVDEEKLLNLLAKVSVEVLKKSSIQLHQKS